MLSLAALLEAIKLLLVHLHLAIQFVEFSLQGPKLIGGEPLSVGREGLLYLRDTPTKLSRKSLLKESDA